MTPFFALPAASATATSPAPPAAVSTATPPPATAAPAEVVVHGSKSAGRDVGGEDLAAQPLRGVAGTFGDPFEAVASLPGVASTASGLAYFYVRGAPPADTGYFLDGIPLPALFHIGPGASVVPPPLVGEIQFFPGAAPARYGRSVGGIIAGTTVGPSKTPRAEAAAGLFEANGFAESPVGPHTTAFVAGRYGYPDLLLSIFAPSVSLKYWDYSGRITHALTPVDMVTLFAIGASDDEHDASQALTPVSSQFHRVDLRYDHRWTGGSVRVGMTLGVDRTGQQFATETELARQTTGRLRVEVEQDLGAFGRLSTGADLVTMHNAYRYTSPGSVTVLPLDVEQIGGFYVDWKVSPLKGVELVPGIRVDGYRSAHALTPAVDPKIAARVALGGGWRAVTTAGLVHQEPTFAVPSPGLRLDASAGLQRVVQLAQGIEARLPLDVTASVTGFYNIEHDMSDLLFDCGTLVNGCSIVQRVDGRAFGLELLVQRSLSKRLGGWLSYTVSRAEHRLGSAAFLSPFDRTHVLSGVVRYDFGAGFQAGVRATYYSGRPETPNLTFPGTDVTFAFGPQQFPQHRLPDYYRIDLRGEKRWQLGGHAFVAAVLELFNATFTREALDYQCNALTLVCDAQRIGPVSLPSIGVEAGF